MLFALAQHCFSMYMIFEKPKGVWRTYFVLSLSANSMTKAWSGFVLQHARAWREDTQLQVSMAGNGDIPDAVVQSVDRRGDRLQLLRLHHLLTQRALHASVCCVFE